MPYSVLDRIKAQILVSKKMQPKMFEPTIDKNTEIKEEPAQTPIQPEDLKNILIKELNGESNLNLGLNDTLSMSEQNSVQGAKEDADFPDIESFVAWLIPNKEKFTSNQMIPLSTLIQSRDFIYNGCNCKIAARKNQSNAYFKSFWENNAKTDLLPKILEVGNFKQIKFSTPQHIDFLVYPPKE